MLKESVILAVSLVLLQYITYTDSCGVVCIRAGLENQQVGNVCVVVPVLEITWKPLRPTRQDRRRRNVLSPATVSKQTACPSCMAFNVTQLLPLEKFMELDTDGDEKISFAELAQIDRVELRLE